MEYNVAGIAFSNILSPMWPPDRLALFGLVQQLVSAKMVG
jgi:hypothetical protein